MKIIVLLLLIAFATVFVIGCGDSENEATVCSVEPVAFAPDLALCIDYDQLLLEVALDYQGGGCECECESECDSKTVLITENSSYSVTCSNKYGTSTADGDIDCIPWLSDWNEILLQAQTENKPIMINFYTDVCPQCRRLDNDTFSNSSVIEFMNENFITLKVDASKNRLSLEYDIFGVPTSVFTEPNGKYIGEIRGYYPPHEFMTGLQKAKSHWEDATVSGD